MMTTIQRTVAIPQNRRLHLDLDLPQEIPSGITEMVIILEQIPTTKRSVDTEKQQRIQRKRETLARLVGICADVPLSLEEIRAERLARR